MYIFLELNARTVNPAVKQLLVYIIVVACYHTIFSQAPYLMLQTFTPGFGTLLDSNTAISLARYTPLSLVYGFRILICIMLCRLFFLYKYLCFRHNKSVQVLQLNLICTQLLNPHNLSPITSASCQMTIPPQLTQLPFTFPVFSSNQPLTWFRRAEHHFRDQHASWPSGRESRHRTRQ